MTCCGVSQPNLGLLTLENDVFQAFGSHGSMSKSMLTASVSMAPEFPDGLSCEAVAHCPKTGVPW